MCVPVGNVTADTEFSFEYGVKRLKSTSQKQSPGANKGTINLDDSSDTVFIVFPYRVADI